MILTTVIIIAAVLIGLTNFFAQFIIVGYKSDPVITGAFMTIAGLVAGIKGSNGDKKEEGENTKGKNKKILDKEEEI